MKQFSVYMNESLNHSVNSFVQVTVCESITESLTKLIYSKCIDSLRNKTRDCLYERVTE